MTYIVADEWQHRGVGSALLDRLAMRAAATLGTDRVAPRLLLRVADPIDQRDHDEIVETVALLRRRDGPA